MNKKSKASSASTFILSQMDEISKEMVEARYLEHFCNKYGWPYEDVLAAGRQYTELLSLNLSEKWHWYDSIVPEKYRDRIEDDKPMDQESWRLLGENCWSCTKSLSTRLLQDLKKRKSLEENGETHLSRLEDLPPESLIGYLASNMIDSCSWFEIPIPRELADLNRVLLGANEPRWSPKNHKARFHAETLFSAFPEISASEVAKRCGVSRATVSKWLKDPIFMAGVDQKK